MGTNEEMTVLRHLSAQMAELTAAVRESNKMSKERLLMEKRDMLASMRQQGLVVESEAGGPDWVLHEFEGMPRGVDFTHQVVSPDRRQSYMFKSHPEAKAFMDIQRELSSQDGR